jgi:hypothetical protein
VVLAPAGQDDMHEHRFFFLLIFPVERMRSQPGIIPYIEQVIRSSADWLKDYNMYSFVLEIMVEESR